MSGEDRRQRVRIRQIPVHVVADGVEGVGYLKNVSPTGVFVRASSLPEPGSIVTLEFAVPDGGTINLKGEVRWNTRAIEGRRVSPGFGVRLPQPPLAFREFFLWALRRTGS